ncbi:MAG: response regulator transcription factor [Terrisporobacter othiniensis]|uniref:response regulator transcription factor n=1 Tax=Terrisporobacter petrolearius TaxID=1460447 RepID=UPI0022DF9BF6|nr:response regulator transcription factor [Terrisporobacter petrolearius]MDU4861618.1 response regulator transcription factor [Terrisporobacter othiniensis]MDU6995271.1 response regulator transcription factor [Terrisporobacter othiniensis]
MKKIIIVEDEEKIRAELKNFLVNYNYEVICLSKFESIIGDILKENAHLVLLDINLPIYDGYYICREIRKKSNVPIIVVSSRDTEMDELMSINLGADDFITKPYNTQILLARVNSILKRTYDKESADGIIYKGLELDLPKNTVIFEDNEIELTKNEFRILNCLMKNKGKIVSRGDLMDCLWDLDLFIDDNTLTVNINRLRKKLEEIKCEGYIETRRGRGYIMP